MTGSACSSINQQPMLLWIHNTTNKLLSSHHNRFTAFFRDHPGEPVPEENFWTLWCKGRLTDRQTHRRSGWAALQLAQPVPTSTIPHFFTGRMPFLPPNQQCQSTEGLFLSSQLQKIKH